jgi:hypothetical protein
VIPDLAREAVHRAGLTAWSPQHRLDPGDQLARREWLGQVVVGAN